MERKLLYRLLQSWMLIAFANADFNGAPLDKCLDFDLANVEELISTLNLPQSPLMNLMDNSTERRENLVPFGAFDSDWIRLKLLHDALPKDSILKTKFKHIFRLLSIAHDQAIKSALSSLSTISRNTFRKKTTVFLSTPASDIVQNTDKQFPIVEHEQFSYSTDSREESRTNLKMFPNFTSSSNFTVLNTGETPQIIPISSTLDKVTTQGFRSEITNTSPKYIEDSVAAMIMKNISKITIDEKTLTSYIPDIDSHTKSSVVTDETIATLRLKNPFTSANANLDNLFINVTTIILNPRESTIVPQTNISVIEPSTNSFVHIILNTTDENLINLGSVGSESGTNSDLLAETAFIEDEMNSTGDGLENVFRVESSTLLGETIVSRPEAIEIESFEQSPSYGVHYGGSTVSNSMLTKSSALSATSNSTVFASTKDEEATPPSTESSFATSSVDQISNHEEFFLRETAFDDIFTKSTFLNAHSSEKALIVTDEEITNISRSQPSTITESIDKSSTGNELPLLATIQSAAFTQSSFSWANSTDRVLISTKDEDANTSPDHSSAAKTSKDKSSSWEEDLLAVTLLNSVLTNHSFFTAIKEEFFVSKSQSSTTTTDLLEKHINIAPSSGRNNNITSDELEFEDYLKNITEAQSIFKFKTFSSGKGTLQNQESSTIANSAKIFDSWKVTDPTASPFTVNPTMEDNEEMKFTNYYNRTINTNSSNTSGLNFTPSNAKNSTDNSDFIGQPEMIDILNNLSDQDRGSMFPTTASTINADISTRRYFDYSSKESNIENESNISSIWKSENGTEPTKYDFPAKHIISDDGEERTGSTTEESEGISTVAENDYFSTANSTPSYSEISTTIVKPYFVKNPLRLDSSRSNNIFRDFKHGSATPEPGENIELYKTGTSAKTGSVWRPQVVRQSPSGNNIWRFGTFSNNVGPYENQRPVSSSGSKAYVDKQMENPSKWPYEGRTNLLRSRKRGSANTNIEKLFRWFYNKQGQIDPSAKSRDQKTDDTKVNIRCKNTERR